MIIHYCEKCGHRIPQAEVDSGAARINNNGKGICVKCMPSRRTSRRLTTATKRDSGPVAKPLTRDSKIRIQPVSQTPVQDDIEQGAEVQEQASGRRKPILLIGGGVAALLLITVLVFALGGSNEDPESETKVAAKKTPPLPAGTQKAQTLTTPPAVQTKTKTDVYDPRAFHAQSLLDQAKAGFKEVPDDPWTYEDKLKAIVSEHGKTKAGEEAKAILASLNLGSRPTEPALPSADEWKKARDLLALANPEIHTVAGKWTLDGKALRSQKGPTCKLALPYKAPDEYDLKLELTRVEGGNSLILNLTHKGKPLSFHLAGWRNKIAGWEKIRRQRVDRIQTSVTRHGMLQNDQRYTLIIRMHKNLWAAYLDGQLLVKRDRDLGHLSQDRGLTLPNPSQLGLITTGSGYKIEAIKVLERSGTGTVMKPGDLASARKSPPKTNTPPAKKPAQTSFPAPEGAAYSTWVGRFQGALAERSFDIAARRLDDAQKNAGLADKRALLKLDQDVLSLAKSAVEAIPKGALALKSGGKLTLVDRKGRKYRIGRKTKVLEANDNAITIEQDIGGGKIVVDLLYTELTDKTLFGLAQLGLPQEAKSRLALAMYRFCDYLKVKSPATRKVFDELAETAALDKSSKPVLDHIQTWLDLVEREDQAEAALQGVEALITEKKGSEAESAFAEFVKTYQDTAVYAQQHPRFGDIKEQIEKVKLQPGLVARYWSGDNSDRKKKFHFSRAVTKLEHQWGHGSPAQGVPRDNFSIEFNGLLQTQEAGAYAFSASGDDRVSMWIDGKKLERRNAKFQLAAGNHTIKITHTEFGGSASLSVKWQPPDATGLVSIPEDRLVHMQEHLEDPEGK